MTLRFREAEARDVERVVALLRDDVLGATGETADLATYRAAFEAIQAEPCNHLIVAEDASGEIVATYQIVFMSGMSSSAIRRAEIEAVRVASDRRGAGLGRLLLDDAEARARAAGCRLIQFTTSASRRDARRFYERAGYVPSHVGYKRELGPA